MATIRSRPTVEKTGDSIPIASPIRTVSIDSRRVRELISDLEHHAMSYAQNPDEHSSRRLSEVRGRLEQAVGLK